MNYIVTGSVGFIGYHTSKALLDDGHNVYGWDKWGMPHKDHWRDPIPEWPEYQAERKAKLRAYPTYEHTTVDLSNPTLLRNMPWPKACCLIHLAAMPGVRASFKDPHRCIVDNVIATTNVLEECARRNIKNVVIASSSSVYGDNPIPFRETQQCDEPKSIYAAAKKSIELIAHAYSAQYGMDITCLRFFTVFGAYGRQDMLPDKVIKALYLQRPITVYGDGTQLRDFTHIDNIMEGIILSAKNPNGYRIINLGASSPMTVNEFIQTTADAMNEAPIIETAETDKADASATWASVGKARREIGWSQANSTSDGIEQTCKWFSEYVKGQQLAPSPRVELTKDPGYKATKAKEQSNSND